MTAGLPSTPPPPIPPGPAPSGADDGLPLRPTSTGPAVLDLHDRLRRVGLTPDAGDCYGPATRAAVERFQASRGLRVDGICGRQTWNVLVEAGWGLGDRLLYERLPMLRGDDVADLQSRLGGLGFMEDKVDGIFGPRTRRALHDFQRNSGLTSDGICGPETVAELLRLGTRMPAAVKAGVVERERLRAAPKHLAGRRVAVGDLGGVGALAGAVERVLTSAGATTLVLDHPDSSAQAQEANALAVDLYLGLAVGDRAHCAYYATDGFVSEGGRRLADRLAAELSRLDALDLPVEVAGMRLPVLRETRMPAVLCELAPSRAVVEHTPALAHAVGNAVGSWIAAPLAAD